MEKSVYLSGIITGLDYSQATGWREEASEIFETVGIEAYDPMRGKDFLLGQGQLSAQGYESNPMSTAKGITARDGHDTMNCGVMLLNLLDAQRTSQGCMIEVGWADAKQVVIVLAMEQEGNPNDHAMLRSIVGYHVHTLPEAIHLAAQVLVPKNLTRNTYFMGVLNQYREIWERNAKPQTGYSRRDSGVLVPA